MRKRNFILQQGFEEPAPTVCSRQYSALHFQPRTVFLWIVVGIFFQSSALFYALWAVLWWSGLLPKFNPFEAHRAAHESWNRRDFSGVVRNVSESLVYTDIARDLTFNDRDKFRRWTEDWASAFSDGRIVNPEYMDAGDTVVAVFKVEGTNDGPLGSLPPTGRKMTTAFCEIARFDKQGRIVSGSCYYDQYTLLAQLGHVQPLPAAA